MLLTPIVFQGTAFARQPGRNADQAVRVSCVVSDIDPQDGTSPTYATLEAQMHFTTAANQLRVSLEGACLRKPPFSDSAGSWTFEHAIQGASWVKAAGPFDTRPGTYVDGLIQPLAHTMPSFHSTPVQVRAIYMRGEAVRWFSALIFRRAHANFAARM